MVAIVSAGLTGCGKGSTTTNIQTTTTGQQLTYLQAASDNGAITQNEFDKKRKDILKNGLLSWPRVYHHNLGIGWIEPAHLQRRLLACLALYRVIPRPGVFSVTMLMTGNMPYQR
ncbi:MAG: SHOCT domain-containing protein [Paracoccaceae bacterium]